MKKLVSSNLLSEQNNFIKLANGEFGYLVPPNPNDPASNTVHNFMYSSKKMPEAQEKINTLLDQIIQYQKVVDSEELRYFTKINELEVLKHEVEKGRLVKRRRTAGVLLVAFPKWLRIITDSLIEYLVNPNTNFKKLKKCKRCNRYFIANKADDRIKYCRICSPKSKKTKEQRRRYQADYRIRQNARIRQEKERFSEAEIGQFMKFFDIPREEAVEMMREEGRM